MRHKKKGKSHMNRRLTRQEKLKSPGVTGYITRAQITKRLQLSINQFRRLCIYKGIHPVEPGLKRIRKDTSKTWYYLKDVNFMKRDEIIDWFRKQKAYKKQVTHLKGLNRPAELAALRRNKPKLDMDHFVKERYPTFQDALDDLDDAVSLIFLFVEMQFGITAKILKRNHFKECIRLKNEWMSLMVETHALRKVFVSIKGIYYQAEMRGSTVTWLVPHRQRIRVPNNVDVVTMAFFVEFYIKMLGFVMYRLYTDLGLHYPPKIDEESLGRDEGVRAVHLEPLAPPQLKMEATPTLANAKNTLTAAERERIAIVNKKLSHIISVDAAQTATKAEEVLPQEEVEVKAEPDEEIPEEFRKVDEEAGENTEVYKRPSKLFSGLKFFINREIPTSEIRFMIRAFGGEEFTEYDCDENDTKITHHVVDREWPKSRMLLGREYIQPQWIFDSINSGILLPYHEYAPDATLPPHISPFINDAKKGYVPKQREHLEELIKQHKEEEEEGGVKKEKEEKDEEGVEYIGEDEEEEEDAEDLEAQYMKELAAEQEGRSYAGYVQDELGETTFLEEKGDQSTDEEMEEALKKKKKSKKEIMAEKQKEDDKDRERMAIDLLPKRKRRIIGSIRGRLERNAAINEDLMQKRKAFEKKQKQAAKAARNALPATAAAPQGAPAHPKGKGAPPPAQQKRKESGGTRAEGGSKAKKLKK